jgi:hypothetical protein
MRVMAKLPAASGRPAKIQRDRKIRHWETVPSFRITSMNGSELEEQRSWKIVMQSTRDNGIPNHPQSSVIERTEARLNHTRPRRFTGNSNFGIPSSSNQLLPRSHRFTHQQQKQGYRTSHKTSSTTSAFNRPANSLLKAQGSHHSHGLQAEVHLIVVARIALRLLFRISHPWPSLVSSCQHRIS